MTKCLAALVLVVALTGCATARTAAPKLPPIKASYRAGPATPWARQWVDTHGIEVAVPARWKLNRGTCGTPTADTVLWNEDGVATCLIPRRPGLSVVVFGGFLGRSNGWLQRHAKRVTIDGAEALRYRVRNEVELYFPHRHITVTVQSPHRALLRQILASVRIVKVNTDGCPTRRFVPKGAVGLVGCYYEAGWLDRSNSVGSRAAQRVSSVLNHASWGSSPAPRGSIASSECGPSWNAFSIAYFEYAHRPPVAVTAHLDGCTHLGASNGKWTVRMSHAWVPTFWNNVAYYGSVADVWGCGC
jgi:hypothetical protein